MKTHLGFLQEVFLSDLSYGVQVRTSVLFGHSYSLCVFKGDVCNNNNHLDVVSLKASCREIMHRSKKTHIMQRVKKKRPCVYQPKLRNHLGDSSELFTDGSSCHGGF